MEPHSPEKRNPHSAQSNIRPLKSAFQSSEVIDLIQRLDGIKIDPVRLHYYEKTGLIQASVRPAGGLGKHKLYSFSDVVMLRWFLQLRKQGLSMQKVRRAISYLRKTLPNCITHPPESKLYFISDGQELFALADRDEVLTLLDQSLDRRTFGVMVYDFNKLINDTRMQADG